MNNAGILAELFVSLAVCAALVIVLIKHRYMS